MEENKGQLFVYGSLRSGFQHHAYTYISRYFTLVAEAKVKGRLYDMGEYPAAVPTSEDAYIIGELYQVNHADEFSWAMAQLDDYEGLHTENGEAPLYRREKTIVLTANGLAEAWVYWFNGNLSNRPVVESGDVLAYIKQKK
ncbi:MAG: gamma-glutamylcyclotransferase family protein [Bacteroidota bacterium]